MRVTVKRNKGIQINKKYPTQLNRSFFNIRVIRANFFSPDCFSLKRFPDALALCETNLKSSIVTNTFTVPGYLPLCCSKIYIKPSVITIFFLVRNSLSSHYSRQSLLPSVPM